MIRTYALQAAAALVCAIVIALLLGGNDSGALQRFAGEGAPAVVAAGSTAAPAPSA